MDAKPKHLEFIQAVIARIATNSFLFKGWAITIAAGLAAFAAVDSRTALLVLTLASTVMFWGLDGYYLWLERCFIELHNKVAPRRRLTSTSRSRGLSTLKMGSSLHSALLPRPRRLDLASVKSTED